MSALQQNYLSGCNKIWTHNHLDRKRTPDHLASFASVGKWLSACLQIKWLWVQILLQSLKCQISALFRERRSLAFRKLQSIDSLQMRMWDDKNTPNTNYIVLFTLLLWKLIKISIKQYLKVIKNTLPNKSGNL